MHIGHANHSYSDPLLESVDIRQIYDKFPEKKGGLKELFGKGPQNAFFLVKFWVSKTLLWWRWVSSRWAPPVGECGAARLVVGCLLTAPGGLSPGWPCGPPLGPDTPRQNMVSPPQSRRDGRPLWASGLAQAMAGDFTDGYGCDGKQGKPSLCSHSIKPPRNSTGAQDLRWTGAAMERRFHASRFCKQ